ncbi:MAG: dihydropteroate synthase [Euryarchaeota archaeon]|nr:dihydropteroate synthase [Euryarchaeota archaeon]
MGVVNVTPDSFSDGGEFLDPTAAVQHAVRLADDGAEILDVGGESTRPGADPVPAEEEWRRVGPVLERLRRKTDARLSIDTYKPEVAAKAIAIGADMVNDITGLRDDRMIPLVAEERVAVVVMHMKGTPKTMQRAPTYGDVLSEIFAFLDDRTGAAMAGGVAREAIVIDPGLGFGKRPEHNTEIVRRLAELRPLVHPILVGASRKSFLGAVGGGEPGERLEASLAAAVVAVRNGADLLRVHDVAATAKALKVVDAVVRGGS